jgi:CRISPR-associated endonuclease Csn1
MESIVDPVVRQTLTSWVIEHGGEPKKAFSTYPRLGEIGPEIRKVRLLFKRQLGLMAPISLNGYADLGSNHHIAVYRHPNGKAEGRIVSLYEASRRLARRQPVVQRQTEGETGFVMSLSAGDTLEFPAGPRRGFWTVCGAWASGQIVLERVEDADHETTTQPKAEAILKDGGRKVSVDPIGRVRPARD